MTTHTGYKRLATSDVGEFERAGSSREEQPLIAEASMEPQDNCFLSFFIFYLLGLGSLLPWNFFITANEYWMYKLRSVNNTMSNVSTTTISPTAPVSYNTSGAPVSNSISTVSYNSLQSLFMNSLALCAMLPNVVFQFLNTVLQKRIPQNVRVIGTLILMIFLFIATEVFVQIDVSSWQVEFFFITLVMVVLINSCSAIFQSSVFGVAACFPQKFSGAVMAGQGMGGVFAALAMIVALLFSNSPVDSAFIFFLMAIAVLTITLGSYVVLVKLDFYRHHTKVLREHESHDKDTSINSEKAPCLINGDTGVMITKTPPKEGQFMGNGAGDCDKERLHDVSNVSIQHTDSYEIDFREKKRGNPSSMLKIARQIWLHMFCIVYTFFITLSCFPAITSRIESKSTDTWGVVYFTPVCCFLLFNLSDWIGRTMASYVHIPSEDSRSALLIMVLMRTVFPFMFALCNVQPRHHLPVIFGQDGYFICIMLIFGVSNGHLSTLCMQYGPKQVGLADAATAGSMLAFMIAVGLLAGASFSFLVVMMV